MNNIVDDLKDRLPDVPGIGSLTLTPIGNRHVYGFNGLIAAVDRSAPIDEIQATIRAAAGRLITPLQPRATPMTTGASNAGLTLKQLMAKHKQMVSDAQTKVQAGFDKVAQGAAAMNSLGDKVNAEGDDLLATVGQFMNDLGGE